MKRLIFLSLFLLVCLIAPLNISKGADNRYLPDDAIDEIGHFYIDCAFFEIEPSRVSVTNDSAYLSFTTVDSVTRSFPSNGYTQGFPWASVHLGSLPQSRSQYMVARVPFNTSYDLRILWSDGVTRYYDVSYEYELYVGDTLKSKCEFWFSDEQYNYYKWYAPHSTNSAVDFLFPLTAQPVRPTPTPLPDTYTIRYIYEDPYTGEDLFPDTELIFAYDFDPFANGFFELAIDGFVFPEWFPVYGESTSGLTIFYKDINHITIYPPIKYQEGHKHFVAYIPIIKNITDYEPQRFDFDHTDFDSIGTEFFDSITLLTKLTWTSYWFLWLIPVVSLIVVFIYKS